VVKSGTNEIHGSLYEYFQNRNLDAADNLSAIGGTDLHPRFDSNRFGGTVGGPIQKNKLFYFFNYEYNPVGETAIPGSIYAPTQQGYSSLATIPGINQTNLNVFKQYMGAASSSAPPATTPNQAYPIVGGVAIPIGPIAINAPSYSNFE